MLKLGLTGSIATGKSTVLQAFADLGVPVFSSDTAVHELYRGDAVPVVERLFPGVSHNGAVDRAELSRRLLAEPQALPGLEAAVHPLVRARLQQFLRQAETAGARLVVVDVPLLFETGFDYGLDRIAVTVVDPDIQQRRALARPGMTVDKFTAIVARQMPQAEKQKRADYIIDTAGPREETRATVVELAQALLAEGTR